MVFQSVFPYTQQPVAEYPFMTDKEINECIARCYKAFNLWKQCSYESRAAVCNRLAGILRNNKEALGKLITTEMGKIMKESVAEIEKCALLCEYYATHAESFLKEQPREAGYRQSFITHEPIGAVLGIMPWNFPFWQVFRYAVPALMAGNVTLLKHAPNVCGCAKKAAELFEEAGAPAGVFQVLITGTDALEKIAAENIVQAITLTGSEKAGMAVGTLAGKNIKKSVLELGGSDALIVLPDADIDTAAAVALQSRMQNAGQSCIGAKRFIVLKPVVDDFIEALLRPYKTLVQGDPFEEATTIGPMARPDLAQQLFQQMQHSEKLGANIVVPAQLNGCNFTPALMMNVQPGMPAFEEETFGPLAVVIPADDEAHALALANQSRYGLGGSIWTNDLQKGIALARQFESGSVFINALVKSDPRLPFGGIKKSGYGRELGKEGILEFVNTKTIVVA